MNFFCFPCSLKGWRDCNRFRPGMLAVTMLCSTWWSSASGRRDKARHCLFLRMSGGIIPLTTGSMKFGVDRMHPDTSQRPLFRAASSRCVWALRHHRLGQISNNVPRKSPVGIVEEKGANHFFQSTFLC